MTKQDLKVGMVVEVEVDGEFKLCMVLPNKYNELCLSGPDYWTGLNSFNDDLVETYFGRQITKVYGLCDSNRKAHYVESSFRDLLWKREEPKELTVSEIEKLLGYPVKIVKE